MKDISSWNEGDWIAAIAAVGLFAVIAVGTLGCVLGGMASRRLGSARVKPLAPARPGRDRP